MTGISKIWDKDNNQLLLLLLVSFLLVYYSPYIILTRIAFLLFLIPIFFTRKDYLWLAWLFIILDAPGYLFKGGLIDDPNRIPNYPIIASITLSFYDLAILTMIAKTIYHKRKNKIRFLFNKEIKILAGVIVFFVLYSVLVFPFDFVSIYRTIIPWSFILICLRFLNSEEKFHQFNKMIFPIIVFALILVIFYLFTGVHFVNLFKEVYSKKENLQLLITDETKTAARSLFSVFLILYSLVMAEIYLSRGSKEFPKYYLLIIISSCFLVSFLTATRGFLIAVSFIIGASLLIQSKNINKFIESLFSLIIITIVFIVLINANPVIKKQYNLAIERYSTIELLLEGDITAGGTLARLDYRGPRVMEHVKQYPLFGYGFSSLYYQNADGDVGFHTVLLNLGFIGTFVLYIIFISIIIKIYRFSGNVIYKKFYRKSGLIILVGLLGLHLFHLSTNIAFGLTPGGKDPFIERYMIYALFLVFFNQTVKSVYSFNDIMK